MNVTTEPIGDTIQFGTTSISYSIVRRKRRRNIAIEVHPDMSVNVLSPLNVSRDRIHKIVEKKAPWIMKKIVWFGQIQQYTIPKEYVTGETVLYMGRQYRLKVHNSVEKQQVRLQEGYLEVALPTDSLSHDGEKYRQVVRQAMIDWYRDHAIQKIDECVGKYSTILGIPKPSFKIKQMTKRWGSCSPKNRLNFNLNIVLAPSSQIEYVVAHELCHLRHKDHSVRFWAHMRRVMPDYNLRREILRKEGWRYVI
jgi:predicted metal-dependent hydrolase